MKIKFLFLILIALLLAGCVSTPPATLMAYNGFDKFIPFIPGIFPEDFKIDDADVGYFEEDGHTIYWEAYQSTGGQVFVTRQQLQAHPDDIMTSSLLVQRQPARFATETPQISEVAIPTDAQTLNLYWVTKQGEEVLIQVVSNAAEATILEFGENLIPSICLSTPTPAPDPDP